MTIQTLLENICMKGAEILAGESGSDQHIHFILPDFSKSSEMQNDLTGCLLVCGELPEDLNSYLANRIRRHACGVIIAMNSASPILSAADLKLCNDHSFPVIFRTTNASPHIFLQRLLPWLALETTSNYYKDLILKQLCLEPNYKPEQTELALLNYDNSHLYYCTIIQLLGADISLFKKEEILQRASSFFTAQLCVSWQGTFTFFDTDKMVCFFPLPRDSSWVSQKEKLQESYKHLTENFNQNFLISVGSEARSLDDFRISFQHALKTLQISPVINRRPRVCFFDDNFLYQLLLHAPEQELNEYVRMTLGDLLENEALFKTLYIYLSSGESIKKTAQLLPGHVNSIRYQLEKIEKVLGYSLSNSENCFRLRIAVTIATYLKNKSIDNE